MSTSIDYRSSSNLNYRTEKSTNASEDKLLLKEAQTISSSINNIVRSNSLQKDYLKSLDDFIKSIETKLDNLESFFSPNSNNSKSDSIASLQNLYDTLITIKNSTFSSSVNLQSFNNLLDEHYKDLLPSINSTGELDFHEKILTTLHFLDAKINQFNGFIIQEDHLNDNRSTTIKESIRNFQVKFHNYEYCLKEGSSRLLHYFELPFPWRENPYIVHGYRFKNNHLHALKSICSCHNETGNIWTHLLGALFMVYIGLFTYPKTELYHRGNFTDNLMMYLYFAASIKCLVSSTFWHAFSGTSNLYLRKKFACVDYTGITLLVTAGVVTTEYAALYDFPTLRRFFISFSLSCGVGGFFLNWSSNFHRSESKPFRIAFYITLAGLGLLSFVILGIHKGFVYALKFYSPIARSELWYLLGVVFYSSLVPEIFRTDVILDVEQPTEVELSSDKVTNNIELYFKTEPTLTGNSNSFWSLWWVDYIFQSHNIWHVFVIMGAWGHYTATYEMFMKIPANQ